MSYMISIFWPGTLILVAKNESPTNNVDVIYDQYILAWNINISDKKCQGISMDQMRSNLPDEQDFGLDTIQVV